LRFHFHGKWRYVDKLKLAEINASNNKERKRNLS